ncbi:hypothetical protein LCGC14_1186970, partial [marine sediment metagenome]
FYLIIDNAKIQKIIRKENLREN